MRRLFPLTLLGLSLFLARPVVADDLPEEAELLFRRGAEAYGRGDLEGALERFLASNRLVQNHNVAFNIAYTYQRLGRYPEAFRYFMEVRGGERDPAQLRRIELALQLIRQHVTVLRLETDPPGATLYLDRVDLGARGKSPRLLGVQPGTYRVIAELEGYHSASVEVPRTRAGEERLVRLSLAQVTGSLRVEGEPVTELRTAPDRASPDCVLPCTLELPPGERSLWLTRSGFRTLEVKVNVDAQKTASLRPTLEPL